ncbi:DUF1499 domain-containing protein [Psychromonas sp. Urea-02u-13]|uniref:DUF1499 domain-containing protein n=1 Tax=Psychromonas sp. Urea-02u-13 TaxID=2058326 RepID=UPI000C31D914|nr:DUF1499 domain-containing protein [Psychromonas sp. Urea-02u-13]PKG37766.1 DUF1499 domain-containing protein [Psychromonas sp. Urea-02u-13]
MKKHVSILLLSSVLLAGCSGTSPTLGISDGQLKACPESPNCVSSQATDKQHAIAPIVFNGSAKQAQMQLLSVINTWDRSKVIVVKEDYIRVEFTSAIMRFIDDVEFYFPAVSMAKDNTEKTEKTVIQVRSASRLGESDLGVNRERIEKITEQLTDK